MALKGSLDTFGMTDVLSLLAMTNKTGDLRLRRSEPGVDVSGYVRLRDGVVVAASADDDRQTLARQLIVTGLIPDDAVASVVASGTAGDALAPALAVAAGLTSDAVSDLSREQVLNAVFDLLRWPSGDFTFEVCSHEPAPVDASITVDAAIAEGTTRLAAWPALTARVPSPRTVLAVTVAVGGDASLNSAEWGVLGLFDGHRTVAEAVTLSMSGEWETVSLVAGLIERGLLVAADSPTSAAHRAELLSRIGLSAAPVRVPGWDSVEGIAPAVVPAVPAVVPVQAVSPDEDAEEPDEFEALTTLAAAASALEAAGAEAGAVDSTEVATGDGVDVALLHQLMAGVRAL